MKRSVTKRVHSRSCLYTYVGGTRVRSSLYVLHSLCAQGALRASSRSACPAVTYDLLACSYFEISIELKGMHMCIALHLLLPPVTPNKDRKVSSNTRHVLAAKCPAQVQVAEGRQVASRKGWTGVDDPAWLPFKCARQADAKLQCSAIWILVICTNLTYQRWLSYQLVSEAQKGSISCSEDVQKYLGDPDHFQNGVGNLAGGLKSLQALLRLP